MAFIILYGMYWSTVNVIQVDKVKYFGMMRYEMESDRNLIQHNVYVAIEPWIFAYYFESPYLYTYGISGYTKTNVVPFGKVEKVYNRSYYQTVSEEFTGPFETTLQRFKDKFGGQLILKDYLQDVSEGDRQIYQTLRIKGESEKIWYFDEILRRGLEKTRGYLCYEDLFGGIIKNSGCILIRTMPLKVVLYMYRPLQN